MSIESRIREQKEKIKEAQRELSKLQDEARRKEEPLYVHVTKSSIGPVTSRGDSKRKYGVSLELESNKQDCNNIDFLNRIESAIESLSSTPSEPKSYVDWNKIPMEYNCVAIDDGGGCWAYCSLPNDKVVNMGDSYSGRWGNESATGPIMKIYDTIGTPPPWDESLIHRPRAKE